MKQLTILLSIAALLTLGGCEEQPNKLLRKLTNAGNTAVTEKDVIMGLKQALEFGYRQRFRFGIKNRRVF